MNAMIMDAIYGGVTVEDVDGDGALEIIAADALGNVVCFNSKGEELWENQVVGEVYHVRAHFYLILLGEFFLTSLEPTCWRCQW